MDILQNKNWYILPRTRAGWWAVALCAVFFISVAVTVGLDAVTIGSDPGFTVGRLNLRGTFNLLVVIAGGVLGLYAVLLRAERSLIVLVPVLLALFAVGFELAESLSGQY